MSQTYLLAWNPKRWNWNAKELSRKLKDVQQGKAVTERWSCGKNKKIKKGDRVYLIKLGKEPRGIFGSGFVTRGVSEGPHWDTELNAIGATSLFIEFQYDSLYDPEVGPILPREILKNDPRLGKMHWDTQSSGINIPQAVASNLEKIWQELQADMETFLPEELVASEELVEGTRIQIYVNAYERNKVARRQCIEFYGSRCVICGFDFGETYGEIGAGFIHVHHLKQLSEIGEAYVVNPIDDLRPVCPNCHAIIHRKKSQLTVEEVKNLIKDNRHD